jgi:hypothetical protein
MKAGKILLAAAFALTLVASANAGIHVWWEGEGIGGQGQTLDLECQIGTRCEWNLTMFIGQDGAGDQILAWAEDLLIDPSLGGVVTLKNNAINPAMPWNTVQDAGIANGGVGVGGYYHLLEGAQGQFAGYIGGPLVTPVLYITLSVNPMPGPASYYIDIMSEGGYSLWIALEDGTTYPYVDFFGAEDSVYGSYGAIRTNAAIRIHAIPEPSTVAFLGLGALALIRRRR